ncbi:trypsin-like peptidase domain-containing protein [Pannus brasiliensis CCIBt3594]|uniref:Trypsin-like peptidase domain-containing protein n=1 Tax=Pannus brasiliensis CCIBt3594 TaxID=1427578 RepID=A0AAW9QN84_9CHRO
MEKYLVSLILPRELPAGTYYSHKGSAVLIEKIEKRHYLLTTNHQVKELRRSSSPLVYLPELNVTLPITIVAQSKTSDIALLSFECERELDTIDPDLNSSFQEILFETEILVYGFPKPSPAETKDLDQLIDSINLSIEPQKIIGIRYDRDNTDANNYLVLLTDKIIKRGQSGGLAATAEGLLIGINQGRDLGRGQGLVSPFWEAQTLLRDYFNVSPKT